VGITRAREKLFLTRAATRFKNGQPRPRTPSRFLTDIPDRNFEIVNLAEPKAARKEHEMKKGRDFFANMSAMFGDPPPDDQS
jgi:DNA helicase-2/ATP-dependent DNA helicase PcrA